MANAKSDNKSKRVVALDGDKLGHVVGTVVATAVMATCFYYQEVDGYTAAVRVGWAFVLSYGATFFLVRVILRTALAEFIEQEQEKKEAQKSRLSSGAESETESGEVREGDEGDEGKA